MCIEKVGRLFSSGEGVISFCIRELSELAAKVQVAFWEALQNVLPCLFKKDEVISKIQTTSPLKSAKPILIPSNSKQQVPCWELTAQSSEQIQDSLVTEQVELSQSSAEEDDLQRDFKEEEFSEEEDNGLTDLRLEEPPQIARENSEGLESYVGHFPKPEVNPGEVIKARIQIKGTLDPLKGSFVIHCAINWILYKFSTGEDQITSEDLDASLITGMRARRENSVQKLAEVTQQYPELAIVPLVVEPGSKVPIGVILHKDSHVFGVIIDPSEELNYYLINPYGKQISLHKFLEWATLECYVNSICSQGDVCVTPVVYRSELS